MNKPLVIYPIAQALGASAAPIIISVAGLVSMQLEAPHDWITLPIFLLNLGVAISTLLAAFSIKTLGRKKAYVLAALVAMIAALVQLSALTLHSFVLFCAGSLLLGYQAAHVQSYRFAVLEGTLVADQGKAISRVMLGGLAAAVIGPQTVVWTENLLRIQYGGNFLGIAVISMLAAIVLVNLPAKPLALIQQQAKAQVKVIDLLRRPQYVIAVLAGVVSYALMSFVMTAAPIAMVSHGHQVHDAALGIQWHVLAMFAPSFFTGRLIDKFGKSIITALGLIIIAAAGGLALLGLDLMHFWGALILLGLGWNFGFTGATALVVASINDDEKSVAQGVNDFLVFSTVAIGSLMAGFMFNSVGWQMLNLVVFPCVALVLALMLLLEKNK
jgi:MFS family permease